MIKRRLFSIFTLAFLIGSLLSVFVPSPVLASDLTQSLFPVERTELTFEGVYPNVWAGVDEYQEVYGNTEAAQTFTCTDSFVAKIFNLYGTATGSGMIPIYFDLTTVDDNGKPSTVVASDESTLDNFAPGTGTIVFPDFIQFAKGETYAIVVSMPTGNSTVHWNWATDGSSPSYTYGTACVSSDGGSSWTVQSSKDRYLRVTEMQDWVDGTWSTFDLSAYIPADATGVLLNVACDAVSGWGYGIRMKGSTDADVTTHRAQTDTMAMVGVNASRQIEIYGQGSSIRSSLIDVYLMGYTNDGATFFTNWTDISLSAVDQWTMIDLSATCPNATAAIVEMTPGGCFLWGLRPYGSTDNSFRKEGDGHMWSIVGLDSLQRCEGWIGMVGMKFYLVGYFTDGIVTFLDTVEKSPVTSYSWQTISIADNVNEDDTPMFAFFVMKSYGGAATRGYADVRALNDTVDIADGTMGIHWAVAQVSNDPATFGQLEAYVGDGDYIGSTVLMGYSIMSAPAVSTEEAADISGTGATLQGYLVNNGGQSTQVRFEWGTSVAYGSTTTWQSKGTGESFTASLTGLSPGTLYYYRAMAKWADDTIAYGTGLSFTTSSSGAPSVTTGTSAGITQSSATIQGSITSMGDQSTVYVSFQWGLTGSYEQSPTSEQTKTAIGGFSASLSGLSASTTYYYRAVLRYGATTLYGSQQSFVTSVAGTPAVSTGSAASLTQTSATIQGSVTSVGDYTYVYVYFEWGLTVGYEQSPTAEQTKTTPGGFSASLSGLIAGTQYYYRAALRYGSTTIYGTQGTFTTIAEGGEPGIDPPDILRIDDVKVFSGYFEDNDQLYVINYRAVYTVGDPSFDVGDYFDFELLDGALIRGKVPVSSWGYRPGSIYLKVSSALLWGEDYTVRLIGNPNKWDSAPYDDYTLSSGDWLGDDLNQLDSWVIALGKSIEAYYDVQLVDYAQGTPYLTEQGTVVFSMGIPGLCQVRPNLCSSYVSYPGIPTEQNEVPVIDTEAETGSVLYGFFEDVADFFNMDDPATAGGLIFGGGFFLIGILLTVVLGAAGQLSGLAGMAIASPILIYGGKLGLIPMQLIVILAAIAVVYSLVIIWLKGQ